MEKSPDMAEKKEKVAEIPASTTIVPGDLVRVNTKVKEGGKERIQTFEGTVIKVRGRGASKMFTVRKIASGGIGVERIWPLNSPSIESVKIVKHRPQRRAKLYYLRKLTGREATGAAL